MSLDAKKTAAQAGRGFVSLCLMAILVGTLTPFPEWAGKKSVDFCILCTTGAVRDFLQNILLFLPLGVALAFRRYRLLPSVVFGAALSLAVEVTQWVIPGRSLSLADICCNSLGTFLGYRIAYSGVGPLLAKGLGRCRRAWEHCKRPDSARANRLMYGGFLLTMGMFGLTTTLLAPSFPEGPYLFAGKEIDGGATPLRIGASGDGIGSFKGAIDEVRIYDRALTPEEIQADMKRPIGVLSRSPSVGLVAAYGFEEESGNRILDASDHGNDGLLDGASRTAGRFGRALVFSGHSDQVIIPHAPILDLRTHFTLEAWVRPEIILNGCPTVIQKGGDHYFLYTGPDLIPGGGATFGESIEGVLAPEALPEGVWSYLALTYDGSGLRIYINGHHRASVVRWFQGCIDEMFVGSMAVHPGLVADNPSLKHALERGEPIRLRGMTGPARSDEGALLDIQIRRRTPILRLTAQGDDLVLRYLTVAAALGLPSPEVRISGALRNAELASPLQVELSGTSSGRSLSVNGVAHHGLGFTLGMGWTVLLYSEYLPPWLREFFNLVWMASWAFLVGFWSQMRRASVGVIVIFGSGLWFLPATGVLVPTPPAQWAAAVLGFLTGFGVRLKIGREQGFQPEPD